MNPLCQQDLGVWTKQANSPTFKYIGQFWKYLQRHKQRLAEDEILIAGDFNSNTQWDKWDRWWNHSDVVRELEELHIKSLYHNHIGQAQGSELQPTFYMYRKQERPYHIDYMFGSEMFYETIINFQIFQEGKWLEVSDHLPLQLNLNSTDLPQ
ncbi:MAG: hypothetical protein ACNI26_08365 [Terasakiella sp.]|uniref:hypothetical protein n=1 Tax=unclassified Terasakiella TaxID=2614952 RepID=UPI003AFFCEB4